jgi:hypothetical protein
MLGHKKVVEATCASPSNPRAAYKLVLLVGRSTIGFVRPQPADRKQLSAVAFSGAPSFAPALALQRKLKKRREGWDAFSRPYLHTDFPVTSALYFRCPTSVPRIALSSLLFLRIRSGHAVN